jgi:O-antigen/teichoic acid export membrane protein
MSAGGGLAIQIVSLVILARLLTPSDFGIITMVTTFSLLFSNFGLNGFTEAVIQRKDLDHSVSTNLFWICVGSGVLLTLGFAAAGSLMADFYRDPRVSRVAAGVSITILITSVSVLHLAFLKRAMRFTALAANDIAARALSVIASIVFAWLGWGYWALVAGTIVLPLSTTLGAWFLCRWTPGLPRRVEGTGKMVKFAMHTYGRFTVNYFSRNTDNLLVGWYFDASSLGFYKKAYDLFALSANQLVSPLTIVSVSTLSRLNGDWERYRRYVTKAVAVLAFIGMGLSVDLTLVGKDLIRVLLGPAWGETGRIFTYFGPGIGLMLLYGTHGWVHLSIGRADRWFRWGIIEFCVTLFLFLLGLHWGPVGIALAWTISFSVLLVPSFWYAWKPTGVDFTPVLAVIWRYLLGAALAGGLTAGLSANVPVLVRMNGATGSMVRLVIVSSIFVAIYLASVIALHRGFGPVRQVADLVGEMLPARKSSASQAVGKASAANSLGNSAVLAADEQ